MNSESPLISAALPMLQVDPVRATPRAAGRVDAPPASPAEPAIRGFFDPTAAAAWLVRELSSQLVEETAREPHERGDEAAPHTTPPPRTGALVDLSA